MEDKEKQQIEDSIAAGAGYGGLAAELERGKRLSVAAGGSAAAAAAAAAAELAAEEEANISGGIDPGVRERLLTTEADNRAKQVENRGRKKSVTVLKKGLRMSIVGGEPILQGIVEKKPGKGVIKRCVASSGLHVVTQSIDISISPKILPLLQVPKALVRALWPLSALFRPQRNERRARHVYSQGCCQSP
jgi:hypothetical protein